MMAVGGIFIVISSLCIGTLAIVPNLRPLPYPDSTFNEIVKDGRVYVDKTEFLKFLVESRNDFYFLARPPGWGKTVFLQTLREYFDDVGKRKVLFKYLNIFKNERYQVWPSHPVLYFDFSSIRAEKPKMLKEELKKAIVDMAGKKIKKEDAAKSNWVDLLSKLIEVKANENKVVILVDNYDNPIEQYRVKGDVKLAEENSQVLKSFFKTVVSHRGCLKLVFVTGVTRFALEAVGILKRSFHDITFDPKFANIIGFSHEEVRRNLRKHILHQSKKEQKQFDEIVRVMKSRYSGYSFSRNIVTNATLYNSFCVVSCLRKKSMNWTRPATDKCMIEYLRRHPNVTVDNFVNVTVSRTALEREHAFDEEVPIEVYMVLMGYLTFISYDEDAQEYTVSFPNEETRDLLESLHYKSLHGKLERNSKQV